MMVFGENLNGQLGIKTNLNQFTPKFIERGEDIRIFACGSMHTIFSTKENNVYVCG